VADCDHVTRTTHWPTIELIRLAPVERLRVRSKDLALEKYDTDKITNRYLEWYDPHLVNLVDREVRLLEIGVKNGGSLLLWRDYFPKSTVAGIDLRLPTALPKDDRIHLFQGSQADTDFLSRVADTVAPEGFDVIIDDASHIGDLTKISFWHLFDRHLKKGGLYVIEDWGTGYWDDWFDGRSYRPRSTLRTVWEKGMRKLGLDKEPWHNHNYGLVGFIKELVDEQGVADLTRRRVSGAPERASRFAQMVITPSIVFITKRAD
jgi:hypothetical protein